MSGVAKLSLNDARGLLEWSQSRLAEEAGLKPTAISDIETGRTKNPGYTSVMLIVAALQRGGLRGLVAEDIFPVPTNDHAEVKAS